MKFVVPDGVCIETCDDEAVILNINSGMYFALNSIGADMWKAIALDGTIETANNYLLNEYEVPEEELKNDLLELLEKLKIAGLLEEKQV